MKEDYSFIARHYRRGHFIASHGWRRLGIGRSLVMARYRIAAAIAGIIVLSATAMFVYRTQVPAANSSVTTENPSAEYVVRIIDFENTSLPIVITSIEETYGVEIENIPVNADELRLSLHYEGNALDLVETINSILGTELTIDQL